MKNVWLRMAQWMIVICLPFWLVITGVQLVANDGFLWMEYNRPDFPEDYYGFTVDDRLAYAPYAINYLRNTEGPEYLGDLVFEDGTLMYNERELQHMIDVKVVFYVMSLVYGFVHMVGIVSLVYLLMTMRNLILRALHRGSLLTLSIIAILLIGALISWDAFFTGFHKLFFTDGTWRFYYSDTLIRLFPEQFWFDAALTVGGFTLLGALIILAATWRAARKKTVSHDGSLHSTSFD